MASTSVDLDRDGLDRDGAGRGLPGPYRNDSFCADLELAVAAAHELDVVPVMHPAALSARVPDETDLHERVQRDAIARLRSGATANPRLLALLAEGRFAEITPPAPDSVPARCAAGSAPEAGEPEAGEPKAGGQGAGDRGAGGRGAGGRGAGEESAGEQGAGGQDRARVDRGPAEQERVDAVGRALAVPDVLCLFAPPGAALTLAVAEVVCAAAERGERVLIAVPEPAAADPIVARLPAGRTLVRTDQAGGGPGTLIAAAADAQQRILARSQAAARRLEPWLGDPSPARGWLRRLTTALAEAAEARERADQAAAEHEAMAAAVRERLGAPLREARQAVEETGRAAALAEETVRRLTESVAKAENSWPGRWLSGRWLPGRRRAGRRPTGGGPAGWWPAEWWPAGWSRAGRLRARLAAASPVAETARAALVQAQRGYEESERHLTRQVEQDRSVRTAADRAAFADLAAHRALESAERSAHHLCRLLDGVSAEPEWAADAAGMAEFAAECEGLEPVLRARAGLLRDWRQRAARPSRQLHAEILRYADVVTATCLGVGRPEHGNLEFDLVVIVDAGRVPLPVALVPLVHARRAVLAGEPARSPLRELPPGWVPDEVAALLTTGVLERVAEQAPAVNRVRLGARL